MKAKFPFFPLLFVATVFCGCGPDHAANLKKNINQSLKEDAALSADEWDKLTAYVEAEKNSSDGNRQAAVAAFFKDGKLDCEALSAFVKGCKPCKEISVETRNCSGGGSDKKPVINVFLENSASVDGYVRGNTEFKNAMYNLLVDAKFSKPASLNLFYLNKDTIRWKANAEQVDIEDYVQKLEPSQFRTRGGDRSTSDLSEVLRKVARNVDTDTLCFLISDCLFSRGNDRTSGYLVHQSTGVSVTFRELVERGDYGALLFRLKSRFSSSKTESVWFYDMNDGRHRLDDAAKRPYFLWVIGEEKDLNQLEKDIDFARIKGGIENRLRFSKFKKDDNRFFTVLPQTGKAGSFRCGRENPDWVRTIEEAKRETRGNDNGQFRFTILVDANGLPADEAYWLNKAHFSVKPSNFEVIDIHPASDETIDKKDKKALDGHPNAYLITIGATGSGHVPQGPIELTFYRGLPNWVEQFSSEDDTQIDTDKTQLDKSFGLKYLVEGAFDAFYPKNQDFFTLKLKID